MSIHLWGQPYSFPPLDPSIIPDPDDKEAARKFRAKVLLGPDPRWFLSLCVKIPTQHGVIPLRGSHGLWPWMQDATYRGIPDRTVMLKARENGSTTLWVAVFLRETITKPGADTIIAADTEDHAVQAINYAKTMVHNLPEWCRPEIGKENETEIQFPRLGSKIVALPGIASSSRSYRCLQLLCTEMAHWKNDIEYFAAVTGAGVRGMKVVAESTAFGNENLFHDLYTDRANGYVKHFYGWRENPTHDDEWFELKKHDIKDKFILIREYPSSPNEAFTGSSDTLWSPELLLEISGEIREPAAVIPLEGGGLVQVWKRPQPGQFYVVGLDAAEGKINKRNKPDWTELRIANWQTGEEVACISSRMADDQFAPIAGEWSRKYNNAHVCAERGSAGLALIRGMQMWGYKNFYYQVTNDRKVLDHRERERNIGYTTTALTKPLLINGFSAAVRALEYTTHDAELLDQMRSFQRATLSASNQSHDDKVVAAALAQEARTSWRPSARLRNDEGKPQREGSMDMDDYDPNDNPRRDRRPGYFELDSRRRGPAWGASKIWG